MFSFRNFKFACTHIVLKAGFKPYSVVYFWIFLSEEARLMSAKAHSFILLFKIKKTADTPVELIFT